MLGWAKGYVVNDKAFADNVFGIDAKSTTLEMRQRNDEWKRLDALTALPPPPVEDVAKL